MVDFAAVTDRQRKVWSLGDFGRFAVVLVPLHSELLCEAAGLRPGELVVDVAAGNGHTALAAARRFCKVVATDFVPELLEQASRRAACEDLELETRVADAQALPFETGRFDVALSTFGVMFAPDQQKAADELVRVVRPGGRIALNSWCPDSLIGDVFRATSRHVPPPTGLRPVFEWGTEERLRELFGGAIGSLHTERTRLPFRFYSAAHAVDYFRAWYGPTQNAFNALDEAGQKSLREDLVAVWENHDVAKDGSLVAFSDYLQVVGVRT
jgi:ubiquinone/menaquinone biosynthesis C-methylase UbiE